MFSDCSSGQPWFGLAQDLIRLESVFGSCSTESTQRVDWSMLVNSGLVIGSRFGQQVNKLFFSDSSSGFSLDSVQGRFGIKVSFRRVSARFWVTIKVSELVKASQRSTRGSTVGSQVKRGQRRPGKVLMTQNFVSLIKFLDF
ncbi:hypothetical protein Hanom_Chr07g00626381 [Helianthus anomalus]